MFGKFLRFEVDNPVSDFQMKMGLFTESRARAVEQGIRSFFAYDKLGHVRSEVMWHRIKLYMF